MSKEHIKDKASKFISMVSGFAEKKIHDIVDKGSEAASMVEKGIKDAYHKIVDELYDIINNLKERHPGEFTDQDLVISPVDIVIDGKVKYPAGAIFEFKESEIEHFKTPLYEPDVKMVVDWARIDELNKLYTRAKAVHALNGSEPNESDCVFTLHSIHNYIDMRKVILSNQREEQKSKQSQSKNKTDVAG